MTEESIVIPRIHILTTYKCYLIYMYTTVLEVLKELTW